MGAKANPEIPTESIRTLLRKIPTGVSIWRDRFGHYHFLPPNLTPKIDGFKLVETVENPRERGQVKAKQAV